ncbi:MAG: beta-ketoacyl-ACP synthase II [Chloroflexota bacterium]
MDRHRVVITGLGAVTPLGLSADEHWQGLISGKSGIDYITLFDASTYPVRIAGEVKGFDPLNYMHVKRADRTYRCTQFAIASTRMALEHSQLDMSQEEPSRVGVVLATSGTVWAIADYGETLKKRGPMRIDPLFISRIAPSMVSAQVGLEFNAKGPNTSLNSACASGSDALGTALNHIRLGHVEVMICGGSETNISPIAIASNARIGALSREADPPKASRPFDLNRDGFVFAEGAGVLVLEEYHHARERGASILAELAGAGWSFDAYSETAPDADQQAVAMNAALRDADVSASEVDYINAHGTSTKLNDSAETRAIKTVLGERAYEVPVSSNKSMTGHATCSAGALEAIATVQTLQNGVIPPTINYETPDPECDLDYVPNKARQQEVGVCLSNSFGMGGQNCTLVIKGV